MIDLNNLPSAPDDPKQVVSLEHQRALREFVDAAIAGCSAVPGRTVTENVAESIKDMTRAQRRDLFNQARRKAINFLIQRSVTEDDEKRTELEEQAIDCMEIAIDLMPEPAKPAPLVADEHMPADGVEVISEEEARRRYPDNYEDVR